MFFVVTVPVIIGMIIRHFAKILSNTKAFNSKNFNYLFVLVFIAIYIEEWDNIVSFIVRAGLIALALNITMMIIGFYVAKFFASGVAQQRCISLECGLQNGTLAAFVGTQIFDENGITIVPRSLCISNDGNFYIFCIYY